MDLFSYHFFVEKKHHRLRLSSILNVFWLYFCPPGRFPFQKNPNPTKPTYRWGFVGSNFTTREGLVGLDGGTKELVYGGELSTEAVQRLFLPNQQKVRFDDDGLMVGGGRLLGVGFWWMRDWRWRFVFFWGAPWTFQDIFGLKKEMKMVGLRMEDIELGSLSFFLF